MKKPKLHAFVLLTAVFAAFTLGLFLGRSSSKGTVMVSVPPALQTLPPETSLPPETVSTEPPVVFPININTATVEEFMALPGIGDVLARRIFAYRETHGSFASPEELMLVEDIGEKRLEDILGLITIGG